MALFSNFSKTKKFSGLKVIPLGFKLLFNSLAYTSDRLFGFPRTLPKIARISITNKCDSRCKTCFIWDYYRTHSKRLKEELTFEEFKKFVDNNSFLEDIMLTGGQVTLRDDIIDMWLYLDKKGYRTGGPTNVVNFKKVKSVQEETLKRLSGKHTHLILISIDGIGKDHERVRGVKGEFKNAIKLLKWALQQQKKYKFLDVTVAHNLTSGNYDKFPRFVDYMVKKVGLDPLQISFRPTVMSSRFQSTKSTEVLMNNKETKGIIEVLESVKKKYKEYNNYFMNGTIKFLKNPNKSVIPCYAGYATVYIDPYWNAHACMDESTLIDNLRKNDFSLKKLWRGKRIKEVLSNVKHGRCHNCWNPCFAGPSMISNPLQICRLAKENFYRLFS